MAKSKRGKSVLRPEGVRRLLEEGGGKDLTNDERALLLALIGADAEVGRELSQEELAALEKLKGQVEGYDAEELAEAVKYMVGSKSREDWDLEWPELQQERHQPSSSEEE